MHAITSSMRRARVLVLACPIRGGHNRVIAACAAACNAHRIIVAPPVAAVIAMTTERRVHLRNSTHCRRTQCGLHGRGCLAATTSRGVHSA